VKQALAAGHIAVRDLIAMIPGCAKGRLCGYDYTTIDRVGYISATESNFVAHWRASFDFTKPVDRVEAVPLKVVTF
jgi:hypothetical protein